MTTLAEALREKISGFRAVAKRFSGTRMPITVEEADILIVALSSLPPEPAGGKEEIRAHPFIPNYSTKSMCRVCGQHESAALHALSERAHSGDSVIEECAKAALYYIDLCDDDHYSISSKKVVEDIAYDIRALKPHP